MKITGITSFAPGVVSLVGSDGRFGDKIDLTVPEAKEILRQLGLAITLMHDAEIKLEKEARAQKRFHHRSAMHSTEGLNGDGL